MLIPLNTIVRMMVVVLISAFWIGGWVFIPSSTAYAGRTLASARWTLIDRAGGNPDVNTAKTVTTGRACAQTAFGATQDEQPTGACDDPPSFRVIPPATVAEAGFVLTQQYAFAQASVTFPTPATKIIRAFALRLGLFTRAEAEGVDPIVLNLSPIDVLVDANINLDLEIETELNATGKSHFDFASNLTGEGSLFALDIAAAGGGIPTVDFTISEFLAAQGWQEATLESDLLQAFLSGAGGPGEFTAAFSLPLATFNVPANVEAVFFNDHLAVNQAPEPSTWLLLGTGILGLLAYRRAYWVCARA